MSLNITLQNRSHAGIVYAYVTGIATSNNNELFFLQADGRTPYYPASPTSNGTSLAVNCAISLGVPGENVQITIPYLAGARLWFSYESPLQFFLNPGPGLVTPSVTNPSDPNYQIQWDFIEFTYNSSQLFANISYVDFVGCPVALTLTDTSNNVQHVGGLPFGARITVCNELKAQGALDGAGWGELVVDGTIGPNLRALSPNSAMVLNQNLFQNYFTNYVNEVWSRFSSTPLTIVSQGQWGNVQGTVQNGLLTFPNGVTFAKPTTANIFACAGGPFTVTSTEQGDLAARLAAAFNRTILLTETATPIAPFSAYYQNPVTNHYARIVHANTVDGHGYAFPYDDVTPDGGIQQAGIVQSGSVQSFVVTIGGVGAYAA